ncbi:Probable lysine-specific demethylase 4B [Gryllus bimaculatus]|nr:Probable lysine-specific demethylase 4B [Gryllus bimaculatus]
MEQGGSTVGSQVPAAMVFRPTYEEFKDFNLFIQHIESLGAHKAGLAKIIPPVEWKPRSTNYDMKNIDMTIPAPTVQKVDGQDGLYTLESVERKPMTVKEYRAIALSDTYGAPTHTRPDDLEMLYWNRIKYSTPMCGSHVVGTLMDDELQEWNFCALGSILDVGLKICDVGLNTPRLNFGMFKTSLPWCIKEMDLYSVNYLHFGSPRTWYSIPPQYGFRFECLMNEVFPNTSKKCPAFLRHRKTLISPQVLKKYKIPYNIITQKAGEFVITFPYGYHSAFDHGFNCIESTHFATTRWIDYGKRVPECTCGKDSITVDLDPIVELYQPDRYVRWLEGKEEEIHPEDPRFAATVNNPYANRGVQSTEENSQREQQPRRRRRRRELPYDAAALQEVLNVVVESAAFQENNLPERFDDFEAELQEESSRQNEENDDPVQAVWMVVDDESDEWPSDPELYLLNGVFWLEIYSILLWEVGGGLPNNIHMSHHSEVALVLYPTNDTEVGDNAI